MAPALLAVTKQQAASGWCRRSGRLVSPYHRLCRGPKPTWRPTLWRTSLGHGGCRILEMDRLIRMHLSEEALSIAIPFPK